MKLKTFKKCVNSIDTMFDDYDVVLKPKEQECERL